jgi:GNAT superfamily N-acetyltransferase
MDAGRENEINLRIEMRPAVLPDDEDFLKRLYFSTREDDAAMWGLPEAQTELLLEMQYRAQKMQYDVEFAGAKHEIVLLDKEPIGRLMSIHQERELLGIDLAILPEHRSKGIGTLIINGLMREAKEAGKIFNFSVVKTNAKAINLYRRLGVAFTGETFSHYIMEWKPE